MTYNNFSVSSGKGKLYLKEKTPTEGYEEITYGTEGKKTYHKYFDRIKGIPKYLESKEVVFDGRKLRFLEITLIDGDVSNKLSLPLKNKGGYTDEVKALLSALDKLELGEEVSLSPSLNHYKNKAGVDKTSLSFYINYTGRTEDGKNPSTGFIHFNDIPSPTSKVVAGEKTWDWTEQTEFYYEKLTQVLNRFSGTQASAPAQAQTPAATPKVKTAQEAFEPATNVNTEEADDLPF